MGSTAPVAALSVRTATPPPVSSSAPTTTSDVAPFVAAAPPVHHDEDHLIEGESMSFLRFVTGTGVRDGCD